jgi:long-chain acyl-CoA synthetase
MGLGELLDAATIRDPASIAIICGNAAITRAELQRASSALADWLLTSGLKPGSRVAIHWCNSIEVVTLYFACFKAGLIAVPINLYGARRSRPASFFAGATVYRKRS